jgi:hypothetical protein
MPESDFAEAQHYAATHLLPWRRIEIMLARLTAEVAAGRGVKDVSPSDFLITMTEPEPATPVVTVEEARQAIGFNPQGRRRKKVH